MRLYYVDIEFDTETSSELSEKLGGVNVTSNQEISAVVVELQYLSLLKIFGFCIRIRQNAKRS